MQSTLISSSNGLPLRAFGGDDAWKVYRSGEYIVSIEMVEGEPAVVVWPANALATADGGVYAVCMSACPYWITQSGEPTAEAYAMAYRGLERMGKHMPTKRELFALMTTVIDAFPWVFRMPPKSKRGKRPAIYEATAKVNGRTLHERAV